MGLFTLKKRSNEQFSVGLKFVAPDLQSDEDIISAEVTITPSESGGLITLGSPIIDVDTVSQVVTDGVDGNDYTVKFKVTTSEGNVFEEGILVCIRDL